MSVFGSIEGTPIKEVIVLHLKKNEAAKRKVEEERKFFRKKKQLLRPSIKEKKNVAVTKNRRKR